jgi:FkbM family methyltransferase
MKNLLIRCARPFAPTIRKALGPTRFRKLREAIFLGNPHDEVRLVACALAQTRGAGATMLDVGGHRGESFEEFAEHGWRVHCFEPNPANHSHIARRIADIDGDVTLFPVAVSDTPEQRLTFYLSDESSGISSLHAFHDTHKAGFQVDAVTLAEHCAQHGITKVDFLKIDVEGHDFFVLKGIDWNTLRPDVIVCEFEDGKTRPLGYTFTDMADYLVARGYRVIVSEWYPIERYGVAHKWRRHAEYPCSLEDSTGWGNLIAVRNASDYATITKHQG